MDDCCLQEEAGQYNLSNKLAPWQYMYRIMEKFSFLTLLMCKKVLLFNSFDVLKDFHF